MFQPVSLFIGYRYSRSQSRSGFVSFITFFSIAGILLGVASLITVVSVMNGFEGQLKQRILGLVPHVVINKQQQAFTNVDLLISQYSKDPRVKGATPYLESEAFIQAPGKLQGVLVQGVYPEFEKQHALVAQKMQVGNLDTLQSGQYNLIVGMALARKLGVKIGDKLRIALPNKTIFTPMGRVPVQRTFTLSGVFQVSSQVDEHMVLIHAQDAARLMRKPKDYVDNIRLYLYDAFDADAVKAGLVNNANGKFDITTWNASQGNLFAAVQIEKNMMWLMLSLIVAVAAFNIVSALVMVVIDKQGEIGILQTLGMKRHQILHIFITQGMVNGLWGTILGAIAGVLLTLNINSILSFFGVNILGSGFVAQTLPIDLKAEQVVVIVASAILMSLTATLYPAYRASKTQPAEVLRNE
ncbi:lipoprotein-releasing ABC transporter permease subunit [Thalassotalea sp. HSM 43]|uniref:lipoprotein-releasing ABC transporter permease subunit n=1 Tax=Thalassotalea sp. HSM 43 TaxID=2552945 RepID=UPI0010807C4F|nr:lipoprotein-releasing ABC transporter permease subunit [Thalassotalea sp. HSM 43]QBY03167.1 lipoprotein-releasing ABC transporter permease subunit [Thalassotalea sp. HSM 43]